MGRRNDGVQPITYILWQTIGMVGPFERLLLGWNKESGKWNDKWKIKESESPER